MEEQGSVKAMLEFGARNEEGWCFAATLWA